MKHHVSHCSDARSQPALTARRLPPCRCKTDKRETYSPAQPTAWPPVISENSQFTRRRSAWLGHDGTGSATSIACMTGWQNFENVDDVNGTGNHALRTTLSQTKKHSKNAPCRWASTVTGQVWFSQRHQLVKMGGAHTHILKEIPLINALLEKTAHQVTGVGGSPVGHAAYAPHTGELSQSDELGRRS